MHFSLHAGAALALVCLHGATPARAQEDGARPIVRVSGFVLDAAGAPVKGAALRVRVPTDPASDAEWSPSFQHSDDNGVFELAAPRGIPFDLAARAEGVGTAYLETLLVDQDLELDLHLAGAARIAGRLRYQDGAPARDVPLVALARRACAGGRLAVELGRDGEPWSPALSFSSWDGLDAERGDGLCFAWTRTDDAGRFELAGLAPDVFHLDGPCFARRRLLEDDADWRKTDGEQLELVADLHRVEVRFKERDGAPAEPSPGSGEYVFGTPSVGRALALPGGRRLVDTSADLGTTDPTEPLWLEPGSYFAWASFDGGQGLFGETTTSGAFFDVPRERNELALDLVRVADAGPERGELVVTTPDAAEGARALVRDADGRFLLKTGELGQPLALPAGSYLVGAGAFDWDALDFRVAIAWRAVEVRDGERLALELPRPAGGGLELTLAARADAAPGGPVFLESATPEDWRRSLVAWLVPRRAGPVEELTWRTSELAAELPAARRLLAPVRARSARAVDAGPYDLVLWRPGLAPVVTPVEIADGAWSAVSVTVPEPAR